MSHAGEGGAGDSSGSKTQFLEWFVAVYISWFLYQRCRPVGKRLHERGKSCVLMAGHIATPGVIQGKQKGYIPDCRLALSFKQFCTYLQTLGNFVLKETYNI